MDTWKIKWRDGSEVVIFQVVMAKLGRLGDEFWRDVDKIERWKNNA